MALTTIANAIEPESWAERIARLSTTKTGLFQALGLKQDPVLRAKARSGGRIIDLPAWDDLATSDGNISDASNTAATPGNIASSKEVARLGLYNNSWGAADILAAVAGADPMEVIAQRVSSWWARRLQTQAVNTIKGVVADNVANDSSDMVTDSHTDLDAATVLAAYELTYDDVVNARRTAGDYGFDNGYFTTIICHSKIYAQMLKANLVEDSKPNEGKPFPIYQGLQVVVNDNVQIDTGGTNSQLAFYTYIVGPGLLRWGEGLPKHPLEVDREPMQGTGGGVEHLISRRNFIMHCTGTAWLEASVAGESPTQAEIAAAANWDRVFARKEIPLAVIRSNDLLSNV